MMFCTSLKEIKKLTTVLMLFMICGCTTAPSSQDHFSVPDLTNWHKESGIRVAGAVSTSTIRLADGSYRIFYPLGGIKSSISADGLTFTEEAGERISKGSGSDYDAIGAKDPDIVVEDGYWRMYYTGVGQDDVHRCLSAVSTDGYTFTKEAGVRVDYSATYTQHADVPSVVKMSSNNYKMYYVYDWYGDNSIKGATSSDGLSWEVKTLSGFDKDCMDPEVVLADDGSLIMFFAAPHIKNGHEPLDIYKATSSDGLSWEVVGRALWPEKSEEGNLVGDPDVIKLLSGQYRIYYYGMIGDSSNIFSATAEGL
jgi:predicted GH43/DUF377 family glycosyl hydrolase